VRPLHEQLAIHLRHGGDDGEDEVAGDGRGVDAQVEDPQFDAAVLESADECGEVARVATEPVAAVGLQLAELSVQ